MEMEFNNMDPLQLLRQRRSIRSYRQESLTSIIQQQLISEATMINTHVAGLKFQLFFNNSDPFTGFFKSYGSFENPSNYMVAVVDEGFDNIWEKSGYYAEQFVIKAVELGLGTCFVGGTYDPSSVNVYLRAGEKILFVVLFGYPAEKIRWQERLVLRFLHRKKWNYSDFFEPKTDLEDSEKNFPELKNGLYGIACAPSALNKRPARIYIKEIESRKRICCRVDDSNKKNLIDLGIAKYNFNFATSTYCDWGNGSPVTGGEPY